MAIKVKVDLSGLKVQKYLSQFGFIDLEFDKFLAQSNRHKTITSPATSIENRIKTI